MWYQIIYMYTWSYFCPSTSPSFSSPWPNLWRAGKAWRCVVLWENLGAKLCCELRVLTSASCESKDATDALFKILSLQLLHQIASLYKFFIKFFFHQILVLLKFFSHLTLSKTSLKTATSFRTRRRLWKEVSHKILDLAVVCVPKA